MRIGVSSYAAIGQPLSQVEGELLGLGVGIEVMCEPPHAWPAPVPWSHGPPLSLHVPILGINIASTNPGIRNESVEQALGVIREAARLGASGVIVHPGIPPYDEVFPRENGLPYAIESLRRCAETAAACGVEVYLENMPDVAMARGAPKVGHRFIYGTTYEELRQIYESVGHPSLRLCLDLGHAYIAGRGVLDALLRDPDVVHVHVNDNHGWRDDHLAWGAGEISQIVDLARDLSDSVQAVIFEHNTLEACRASLRSAAAVDLMERVGET